MAEIGSISWRRRKLAPAPSSRGNLAFAVGCVRAGIHVADGYPGTPFQPRVIDKGLRYVQQRCAWAGR